MVGFSCIIYKDVSLVNRVFTIIISVFYTDCVIEITLKVIKTEFVFHKIVLCLEKLELS